MRCPMNDQHSEDSQLVGAFSADGGPTWSQARERNELRNRVSKRLYASHNARPAEPLSDAVREAWLAGFDRLQRGILDR
ncbi:MAG: hypothetical protein RLZZ244_122 [Verrucomicrobiota bacterium]|jgi:hypothetical protein